MKIFLTGGTGFIGSHFLNQALSAGHEVTAQRRTPESRPRIPLHKEPTWLDVPFTEMAGEELAGHDCLLHLASHSTNPPYDTYPNCIQANVTEPLILFERAAAAGLKKWVVAGSCFEYGPAGERYDRIPPNAPLEPNTSYSASKAAAGRAFESLARDYCAELLIGRVFHVFGEGELEKRFWPTMRRKALAGEDMEMTEGLQVRDFVPVEMVAAYFLSACHAELTPGVPTVENVGSGAPQTLRAFAESWWQRWQATGELHFGKVPYRDNECMKLAPLIDSCHFKP